MRTSRIRAASAFVLLATLGASSAFAAGGFGMTWAKSAHETVYSTDKVACGSCNPYTGETACTTALPILCIRQDGSGNPGLVTDYYNGWASGHIHLTPPVAGTALTSLAAANMWCVSTFGTGYRMAEFHDGLGGWGWSAYGNVNGATRFWVYINDQSGNCWNP
jgi:hypothetical protein